MTGVLSLAEVGHAAANSWQEAVEMLLTLAVRLQRAGEKQTGSRLAQHWGSNSGQVLPR